MCVCCMKKQFGKLIRSLARSSGGCATEVRNRQRLHRQRNNNSLLLLLFSTFKATWRPASFERASSCAAAAATTTTTHTAPLRTRLLALDRARARALVMLQVRAAATGDSASVPAAHKSSERASARSRWPLTRPPDRFMTIGHIVVIVVRSLMLLLHETPPPPPLL